MPAAPVIQVALPVPLPQLFDYLLPPGRDSLRPGARVLVPFGRRKLVGLVIDSSAASDVPAERLLSAEAALDDGEPLLDAALIDLLGWCWP